MTGEEMKIYLKQSGISLATIAEGLGISPQNLNGKLKAKSLKTDFVAQIRAVIDSYASSLSTEMEGGRDGKNVIFEAQEYLKILGMCEEMFNQKLWVNEDGHICDEEGNRLSDDREHRVFEVIKGGK